MLDQLLATPGVEERCVLGLPKEPGPAKDTPFRELLVGTQRS